LLDRYTLRILEDLEKLKAVRFKDLLGAVYNPRTLSKKLGMLMSMGLIEADGGFYKLSAKGETAVQLLKRLDAILELPKFSVMNVERIPHRAYADLLERYCEMLYEYYQDRLVGILLLGSVARGDWDRNSDVDLLLVVEGWEGKFVWERTRELLRLKRRLEKTEEHKAALKKGYLPIIQHYPLSKTEALKPHRTYIDACIDGIVLYEKGNFLTTVLRTTRDTLTSQGARRILVPGKGYYWVLKEVKAGEAFEF